LVILVFINQKLKSKIVESRRAGMNIKIYVKSKIEVVIAATRQIRYFNI